jgi:hypothetical protein
MQWQFWNQDAMFIPLHKTRVRHALTALGNCEPQTPRQDKGISRSGRGQRLFVKLTLETSIITLRLF